MKALSFIFMIMFYFGLKTLFTNKKHILMMLMCLEFIGLIILIVLSYLLMNYSNDYLLVMYFLVVLVCESVLGVTLLTLAVRFKGNDYMKSLSLILC